MTFLTDLLRLFYPELCINCNNILTNNENLICTFCRHDLPLTHYKNYSDNKVAKIFKSEHIKVIVNNIDKNLPKELKIHKLPIERKELMVKLINLRFNKLLELI